MTIPRELDQIECVDLISPGGIGRLATCTAAGAQIRPLSYVVDDNSIVFRTSAYGSLATGTWDSKVAFEVDELDFEHKRGWSVVATGRAEPIDDPDEASQLASVHDPKPWADGMRRLYVRLRWQEITGRVVGEEWMPPASPGKTGSAHNTRAPWSHG